MSQYLSEDIKQPIVHSPPGSPRNVYLLKAPTGSGKTTFFIKDLVPEARRRRQQVLLIVNRSVLNRAAHQHLPERVGHTARSY